MKKFTVKDFIAYSIPCFSCKSKNSFRLGFFDDFGKSYLLRPSVSKKNVEVNLYIHYDSILHLTIHLDTSKIATSDHGALTKYLTNHKLYLSTLCNKCQTLIESRHLTFDLQKNMIAATTLSQELIMITDKGRQYRVYSDFDKEVTQVKIYKVPNQGPTPLPPIELELPLLPIHKMKDKSYLLNKLRTYILFS
jgi:hypothetical protein